MNCKQANQIPIRKVLESFSLFPSKENHKAAFYYAIDREEKTPSFHVDFVKNKAFDFGTGKRYDNVLIVQTKLKCSVQEALEYLVPFDFSFHKQKIDCFRKEKTYQILKVCEVKHPALIKYLRKRKVEEQKDFIKEVHYELNGKEYFAIGFKNDSDGFEVRNPYVKICLGEKNISTIKKGGQILRIFEGFFDFLSFEATRKTLQKPKADSIILNSVSMVFKVEDQMRNYQNIELYFDNDKAGDQTTLIVKEWANLYQLIVEDCRILYRDYKDLNDFIRSTK